MNHSNSPFTRRTRGREIDFHALNDGSDEEIYNSDEELQVKRPRKAQKQATIQEQLSVSKSEDDNISPHESASQVQASQAQNTDAIMITSSNTLSSSVLKYTSSFRERLRNRYCKAARYILITMLSNLQSHGFIRRARR